ncbi:MAG TPA: aldo/keto reductase [Beijerinckiaceae bacterium]|nr:aldo/keto reductase [Beijerinckiaceae bacterium]
MAKIGKRAIGKTGLKVSSLGFGGAPLGDLYALLDEATAVDAVVAAIRSGTTLIDTSPLYGHGLSEHRIGAALRRVARPVVLSTKVGRVTTPARGGRVAGQSYVGGLSFDAAFDYSYDGAMRSLEQSLLRLGRNSVDILLIHDVDVWTHGPAMIEQRFKEAMNGAYRALERLRAEGTVRAIGVGVNEAEMCARFATAGDFDCMLLAGRYSLLEQGALDTFLPLAERRRISVLLGGVFNSGILATGAVPGAKYNYQAAPPEILERVRRIEEVCVAHRVPLAAAAVQFPLAHPAIASVVLGAVTPAEVERNLAGVSRRIPPRFWDDLRTAGVLPREVPTPGRAQAS